MRNLTAEEAFKAMFFFLDKFFEKNETESLAIILGELDIADDGTTRDTAAGIEWLECLKETVKEPLTELRRKNVTIDEAYDAMYRLISRFSEQMGHPEDLVNLINYLEKYKKKKTNNKVNKWLTSVDAAIKDSYPLDVNKFDQSAAEFCEEKYRS